MNTGGVARRVLAGLGANSVGMALTIGLQLASLPLFLAQWDTNTYGVWLMLSALPGYLAMADVGMVTAAGNQMAMAMGAGNAALANRVFHSAGVFTLSVCGLLLVVGTPLVYWMPWPTATWDQRLALWALCAGVLVAFWGGLSEQVFKATQRYAQGTMWAHSVRLGEWLGWMVGLWCYGSFAAVALCGLVARVVGTLWLMRVSAKNASGLTWGVNQADLPTVKRMTKPAMAFMAFPFANALSFQGVTLLVGSLLGPTAVAVFSTYRTLARSSVQLTALFSHALWPEFSSLYGQGNQAGLQRLAWRSMWLSGAQALAVSTAVFVLAPWILQFWTHGQIAFDAQVFALLMAYAAVGGLWHVPRVLLMATNHHGPLAGWSLLTAALCVGTVAWWGGAQKLVGVGGAMLFSETLIAGVCVWLAWATLHNPSALQKAHT